jgi:hypothetical protein
MAKIYGQASKYIRKIKIRNFLCAIFCLAVLIIIVNLIISSKYNHTTLLGVIFLLIIIKLANSFGNQRINSFFKAKKGSDGEKDIANILKKMPDDFSVYWGLKFPGHGDIDFTVVGPTGVFTIEVKSHSGQVGFTGQELMLNRRIFKEGNILHQAFGEAMIIHDYLLQETGKDIFVTPIIVFSSDKSFVHFGQNKINNVYVIKKDWLLEIINKQPKFDITELPAIEKVLATLLPI